MLKRTISGFVVMGLVCISAVRSHAEDVQVTWKKAFTGGWESENKLPAGVTVKIRVHSVRNDAINGVEFTVNGDKHTAKKNGDEFRGKVDENGKLLIKAHPFLGAEHVQLLGVPGPTLCFGKYMDGTNVRYALELTVRVAD